MKVQYCASTDLSPQTIKKILNTRIKGCKFRYVIILLYSADGGNLQDLAKLKTLIHEKLTISPGLPSETSISAYATINQ